MLAHALLAFLFLQLPQNDTSPQGVPCHTKLVQIAVFGEFYFDWLHSGFYNDSKDRLQSEMKINSYFYWHHSGFDDNNMGRLKKFNGDLKNIDESKVNIFDWFHSGFV